MPNHSNDIEARIQNAYNAFQQDKNLKITQAAREFDVPYYRLRSRLGGAQSKTSIRPVNHKLDKAQEDAVKHWIHQLDEASHAPTAQQVEACANSILQRHHIDPKSPPPEVGSMWVYQFIKCFPNYKRLKQKPMDLERLQAEDLSIIQV